MKKPYTSGADGVPTCEQHVTQPSSHDPYMVCGEASRDWCSHGGRQLSVSLSNVM